ncbi:MULTISPECIES: L-rhamnose isomerase [unclassified Oceanispirochaeta]|uniref:L-rhamnose isomerase n=1 Tax=unclassified Oceanispirochaeta TaxID=2635722 RepID=UPI000E08FD19|nr:MULTISPECIES: L-rhamnose isomerase [unclassified Oceanispirochaeta]MBF9014031.1 L-rhamnose isomerase [Oceanispirochaeta sp. M2]NPD70522.1 L-rhamnose isomerase [Oceanispirochaeta sp. M1]RDG34290.1 L-rhamnose isomerase [Oceanispirochaeta sp. M1]
MSQIYDYAKEQYAELGVDVDTALAKLKNIPLSVHCWQGDDVGGFETPDSTLSGGGIQVTGNYPGKAGNPDELKKDLEKMYSLLPGRHRLNLHAIYGDFHGKKIDRDQIEPKHFQSWVDWGRENGVKLDFNATCFSHPMAESGFTLSSKDKDVREFWIDHVNRARDITAFFGKEQGSPSVHNLWIPDGAKDNVVCRMDHRTILKETLDKIYSHELNDKEIRDAVECKLFGIGSESFVVGSHEFYMGYALTRNKLLCMDMGHFHPTESIADKISSVYQYLDEVLLHVSRPVRWDSDHVVNLNDDIYALMQELVRSGKINNTYIGLDFFDGTLNRIGAWAVGARASLKGLLYALLEPYSRLKAFEEDGNNFGRMALLEESKTKPFGIIWDYYCQESGTITDRELIADVMAYEKSELSGRQ